MIGRDVDITCSHLKSVRWLDEEELEKRERVAIEREYSHNEKMIHH